MKLSKRLSVIEPSMTMAVTAKAAELRAAGVDVISFGAGEPDFDTPDHIKEAAKAALDAGATKYTAVGGTPALKAAVAEWFTRDHGFDVSPAEVMVNVGAKQSIYNALHTILDEGDEVVLPAPYWVSYSEIVKLAGGKPVPVVSGAADGFVARPEAIAEAITDKTRAVMINSPCNPTGGVFGEADLRAIAELADKHDLWLITDDIYRYLCYGDAKFVQPAGFSPEVRARTIIVDGVSKAYSMTGWRIGFTCAPPAVIKGMSTLQGQSTSNPSSISQAGALAAITGPQDCVATMREAFDERRKFMVDTLNSIESVTCLAPKGAFYAFPDVSAFIGKKTPRGTVISSDLALCEYLISEAKIAVVPGSAFFGEGFVRLSYATSKDNIDKGLQRLRAALGELS